jgi:hypothetical protein
MTSRLPGVYKHVVFKVVPRAEPVGRNFSKPLYCEHEGKESLKDLQMFPIEHGEKVVVFCSETGDMMYAALASHVERLRGQQLWLSEHPVLQSWTVNAPHISLTLHRSLYEIVNLLAPKLCPISCAMTCHSLLVEEVTPVPLVISPSLDVLVETLQSVPSHATPTSLPLLQLVKRCHSPAPSLPPLLPLH